MNLTMFALIHLCVKINNKEFFAEKRKGRHFTDFDPDYFWKWTDFLSYLEFILSIAVLGSILMYFFLDFKWFVDSIGFLAVFTEAMLGVPQFYRNFKNKSTYGMSLPMVLMWTCGDVFKTTYFVLRKAPPQFFICGSLQVTVDLMILGQVWLYRLNTEKRKRSELGRRPGLREAQSRSLTPAASWTRTIGLRGHPEEVWKTPRSRTWKYCGRTLFWSLGDESRVLLKYNTHFIQMLPLLCQSQFIQPVSSFHLIRAASIFGTYILT